MKPKVHIPWFGKTETYNSLAKRYRINQKTVEEYCRQEKMDCVEILKRIRRKKERSGSMLNDFGDLQPRGKLADIPTSTAYESQFWSKP